MEKHGDLTALAQSLLEYVEDLLTASPKESFTKVDMLLLLNAVKNDRDLIDLLRAGPDRGRFGRYRSQLSTNASS